MGLVRKPAWNGEYLPHGAVGMTVAPVRVLRSGRVVKARRGGMGADLRVDPVTGASIDCDAWGNFFNGTCWGVLSQKGQQSYIYGNSPILSTTGSGTLPTLAKAAGAPTSAQLATVDPAQLPGDLAASQFAANQIATQQFFVDLNTDVVANRAAGGGCSQNLLSGVCDWLTLLGGGALVVGLVFAMNSGGRR